MGVKLSAQAEAKVEEYKKRYPDVRSAIMPALYIAQEELGSITEEAVQWVAERIGVAPVHIMEVATFYTMYRTKPVGKYHVQVCRTLSCAVVGAPAITECVKKRLGTKPREATADGMWSYEEVECLGSCGSAPMCEINDCFFEKLTPEKMMQIMDQIEREQPDLSFSAVRDELGVGLKDHPKSEVV